MAQNHWEMWKIPMRMEIVFYSTQFQNQIPLWLQLVHQYWCTKKEFLFNYAIPTFHFDDEKAFAEIPLNCFYSQQHSNYLKKRFKSLGKRQKLHCFQNGAHQSEYTTKL